MPTQISGAKFLADLRVALLADEPRVGKTGAAIIAADMCFYRRILVVTTASGRPVWARAFPAWSGLNRRIQVVTPKDRIDPQTDVVIVGWPSIADAKLRSQLLRMSFDLLISDEDHYAKNFAAKRTQALYGTPVEDGARLLVQTAVGSRAKAVWALTGTPAPNSPLDFYPRLRALAPERLVANPERGWPDVVRLSDFQKRYTITRPKKIGRGAYGRWIDVVMGGRNEAELRDRIEGFMLLRTQADVGIRPPVYETMPLIVSDKARREAMVDADQAEILAAAESGDTKALDMHLGPLRRLTGQIKARAVIEAVKEEFECGLDKVVLAYWHRDVGDLLEDAFSAEGVVRIDGATSPDMRATAEQRFREGARVALAQIIAAGEAIDLSAAAELIFVETSSVPKDMRQMSDRIQNINQTRSTRVRVATLAGSIDDALQAILMRKWSSIREVLS